MFRPSCHAKRQYLPARCVSLVFGRCVQATAIAPTRDEDEVRLRGTRNEEPGTMPRDEKPGRETRTGHVAGCVAEGEGNHESSRGGGYFSFERLDAYQVAREFRAWVVNDLQDRIPRGESDSRDQIRRASKSIPFNIAEGAEQESLPMARKHYRHAKASAGECCAILNDLEILGVSGLEPGFQRIRRLGAMLRKLAR